MKASLHSGRTPGVFRTLFAARGSHVVSKQGRDAVWVGRLPRKGRGEERRSAEEERRGGGGKGGGGGGGSVVVGDGSTTARSARGEPDGDRGHFWER